jgi:hypothetical protein
VSDLLLQATFVIALSLVGGVATYLQGVLVLGVDRSKAKFMLDILLSFCAGFGSWFLCVSQQLDVWLTLFCVLVAGLNGAEILQTFKKKLYSVINAEQDK